MNIPHVLGFGIRFIQVTVPFLITQQEYIYHAYSNAYGQTMLPFQDSNSLGMGQAHGQMTLGKA